MIMILIIRVVTFFKVHVNHIKYFQFIPYRWLLVACKSKNFNFQSSGVASQHPREDRKKLIEIANGME